MRRQYFQSNSAAKGRLLRLIDHSHPTLTNRAHNAIVADLKQGRCPLTNDGSLGGFDFNHGRKQVVDFRGKLRITLNVFLKGRPLAAAQAFGELLRNLVEKLELTGKLSAHTTLPGQADMSVSRTFSRLRARK